MNIADCEVNDGRITREWLVRDNLALAGQLGIDPLDSARAMADRFDEELITWIRQEFLRTGKKQSATDETAKADSIESLARLVLENCWITGNSDVLETVYAPYCVMQRAPVRIYSGREKILDHYAEWRNAFPDARLSIDHICSQPFNQTGRNIAVRWSIAGRQKGEFAGREATGKPVYILGVTHWKIVDNRIAAEWTVFDELAMLAQTLV
jgi:predicted ester cyclase